MKNRTNLKQILRYKIVLSTLVLNLIGASSTFAKSLNAEFDISTSSCVSSSYGPIGKELVGAWKIPQKNVGSSDSSQVFILISSRGEVKMVLEDKNGFLPEEFENFYSRKVLFFLKKVSSQKYTANWSCDYLKFMKENNQDLGQVNDSQKPIITIKAGKLYVNTTKEDQYYDKASIKDVNQVIEQNKKVKIEKDLIIKNEIFPLIGRKFALTSTEFNGFDNEGKPFHFTQPASSLQESYSCGSTSTQEPAETCYNPKFLQINSKKEAVINGKVLARISLYKGSNDKDFSMMFLVSNPAKPNHSTAVLRGRVSYKGHQLSVRSLWTSPEGKTSESIYYFEELK